VGGKLDDIPDIDGAEGDNGGCTTKFDVSTCIERSAIGAGTSGLASVGPAIIPRDAVARPGLGIPQTFDHDVATCDIGRRGRPRVLQAVNRWRDSQNCAKLLCAQQNIQRDERKWAILCGKSAHTRPVRSALSTRRR
jgi:hypothetical protein